MLKRIEKLESEINKLLKRTCPHDDIKLRHESFGHLQGLDYVGGDSYYLECQQCGHLFQEVTLLCDDDLDQSDRVNKLKELKKKYEFVEDY